MPESRATALLEEFADMAGPVLPCRFKFGSATVAGAFDMGVGVAYESMRTQERLDYTGRVDILFGNTEQPLFEDVCLIGGLAMDMSQARLQRGLAKLQQLPPAKAVGLR